jgi:hypothetical protein
MDTQVGAELKETVEASLSSLLSSFNEIQMNDLISLLVQNTPELSLKCQILDRLPIKPLPAAILRQSLAKAFLHIPAAAPSSSLLTCLQSTFPFTEVKRDISNEHARAIKYALQIFDVAVSKLPSNQDNVTREIIVTLKNMDRSIIDNRSAFMTRTATKEMIQRLWMRLEHGFTRKNQQSLDKLIYD